MMGTHEPTQSTANAKSIACFSNERRKPLRTTIEVCFTQASADDTCCIMQEPIDTVELELMPDNPAMFPDSPSLNKATIAKCGHSFHAGSLIYHFMRNCMACPVCRHGSTTSRISAKSFGSNRVIKQMQKKVTENRRQERELQIQEETRELSQLVRDANYLVQTTTTTEITQEIIEILPWCSIIIFPDSQSVAVPETTFMCPIRFTRMVAGNGREGTMHFETADSNAEELANVISSNSANSSRGIIYITTR
jgi:hypothetical protein